MTVYGGPTAPAGGGQDLFTQRPPGPADLGYREGSQPWILYGILARDPGTWYDIDYLLGECRTTNHRTIYVRANQRLERDVTILAQWGRWHIENNGAKGGQSAYRIIPVDAEGRPKQY